MVNMVREKKKIEDRRCEKKMNFSKAKCKELTAQLCNGDRAHVNELSTEDIHKNRNNQKRPYTKEIVSFLAAHAQTSLEEMIKSSQTSAVLDPNCHNTA
jgi:hypothetical protein